MSVPMTCEPKKQQG